ncbi:MAG: zinc ribbon domain-containing protein [Ilumatobacteraceae bacterium]
MNAASLLALQDIDTALTAVANRRPRLPELVAHKAAVAAVDEHRAKMAVAQARIDGALAAIEAAEHVSEDITRKRTRLEAQLKTVIAPREAEALMHQIATLNGQRDEQDEQELLALDEHAAGESELAALAEVLPVLEGVAAATETELQAATAALDAEEADLRARRPEAASAMTDTELAAYDRARQHFDGVAIARLEGHRCHGCHMDLSPAEMDTVRGVPEGALPECPQCGRYLVR